jgi:hypothetical protein
VRAGAAVALAAVAYFAWSRWGSDDERAIRERIEALRSEVNRSANGLAAISRATNIGSYFTEDVVVDLGQGAAPIRGRMTIMGMAERLQPRTAAFRLEFDDVSVEMTRGGTNADVTLTASFIRGSQTGEESRDAREFALGLTKAGGTWRIANVTAIDVLR